MEAVMEAKTRELPTADDTAMDILVNCIDGAPDTAPIHNDAPPLEEIPLIGNSADVAYQIRQVNQLLEDVATLKTQASEAAEFYQHRIERMESRADMLKENCGRWLKLNGLKKLATHSGTIFFSSRKKVTLPDTAVLLEFISQQDGEVQSELQIVKPNLTTLKQFIQSSGKRPEGYLETPVEGITIRKVA